MNLKLTGFILLLTHDVWAGGFPVVDAGNIAQSILSIAKQVEEMERNVKRVEFQVRSAQRFAEKLHGYKFSSIGDLLRDIRSFQYRTRSISYTYKSIVNQFEKTYGKHGDFSKNHSAWEKQSDDSIKDAMEAQGLVEKSDGHMRDLDRAVSAKNEAESDAETLQAIGEVNAIQSKQLNDLKHIIATDARARHSVIMEQRSKERELKNYEAHLMKDFNVHKKSRPLAYMPSLGSTAPQISR